MRLQKAVETITTTAFPAIEVDRSGSDLMAVMPILTHYEGDSGPFITTGLISALDPETGAVARGIHRMEVRGPDRLGAALINPPLGVICQRARESGSKVKVAVSIGLEPATFLGSALKAPPGVDKLALAGALRGSPVEVALSPVNGIPVPARSEFLLEGVVDPADQRADGPLGEISGYALSFPATPTLHITSITHRKNPVYQALSPAGREADLILTLVAEATLDPGVRKSHPQLLDFGFVPGTFGSVLAVRVAKTGQAEVKGLLLRLLSMPMVKKIVAVAEDVDPCDLAMVEWSIATRCQPDRDLLVLSGLKGQPIDPSTAEGFVTSKVALDATGYNRVNDARRAVCETGAQKLATSILDKESR